jgi:formiminoglutamase
MKLHHNPSQENWTGRNAMQPEYWHQVVRVSPNLAFDSSSNQKVGILGYTGEEGVKRNQGRLGTIEGPASIRKCLGTLAHHLPAGLPLFDYGDVFTQEGDLESTHQAITKLTYQLLQSAHFPVWLGGGHDLAFPHGSAVLKYSQEQGKKLGIINLDAHFDLRPLVKDKGHSGSPFYQLASNHPNEFHYLALGIQRAANPKSLFETAAQLQADFVEIEQFNLANWAAISQQIQAFVDRVDAIYLTVDMDGFSSAFAPGVSAPSPMGFDPEIAFNVVDLVAKSKKLISLDVVELNPVYDQDLATARLAARCVEYILRKNFG